jgi:hypothetical protein
MERTGKMDGNIRYHLPGLYHNDFWTLNEYFMPINDTVETLPLNIIYYPISFTKYQIYIQMEEGFKQQQMWGTSSSEIDRLKVSY